MISSPPQATSPVPPAVKSVVDDAGIVAWYQMWARWDIHWVVCYKCGPRGTRDSKPPSPYILFSVVPVGSEVTEPHQISWFDSRLDTDRG